MLNPTVRGKKSWWCALSLSLGLLSAPAFNANAATATYSLLFSFDLHTTAAGVVEGDGGNLGFLFGTTNDSSLSYGGSIFKVPLGGGAPQVVYQLQPTDGYSPVANLLRSTDHFLYGTTHYGPRVSSNTVAGYGTIFRVAQDGSGFTTLHTFTSADGAYPDLALIEDATFLYGVTVAGGTNNTGTVFRLRKADGLFQVLHNFAAVAATGAGVNGEGATPSSSLTLSAGLLYGVTSAGGANLVTNTTTAAAAVGAGTIYSQDPNSADPSSFQTVYKFSALDLAPANSGISTNQDGAQPRGGLLEYSPGLLVGTTSAGGTPATAGVNGYGTVFRFDTATATLSPLYVFDSISGATPIGSLLKDANSGLVYGVTASGSSTSSPVTSSGSIYQIDPIAAVFTNDHPLAAGEGVSLTGSLIKASNGDLFGTVASGGACTVLNGAGYGAVFRYSITSGGNSSGYASCTQPTNGGKGSFSPGMLWLLAVLGLAPSVRRRWLA